MTQADLSTNRDNSGSQCPDAGALPTAGVAGRPAGPAQQQAPIWLAALEAAHCRALGRGVHHEVRWLALAGRALYTNYGASPEWIEPLGVILPAGCTLAVHWAPGETEFTLEVYADTEKCA